MSPRRENSPRSVPYCGPALGHHLRRLRLARGWTQEAFAERSDVSVDTVRRLERGAVPNIDTLVKLCTGFDLSVSRFFTTLELSVNDITPDVIDLLRARSPREQALAISMLHALFAKLDNLRDGGEPIVDEPTD